MKDTYDLIYIDGSHFASDVLEDAVLSWSLLKDGGLLVFDDYGWEFEKDEVKRPQIAIDAFLSIYKGKYKMIHKGFQVWIKKTNKG